MATSRSRAKRLQAVDDLPHDRNQIDRRVGPLVRAQLDPRQRQQVVDQPRHAPGLRLHDAEEALARRRVLARRALQGVDEAGDGGERRAQLVADIGDEVGAHLLDAADRGEIVHGDDDDAGGRPSTRHRRDEGLRPARRRQPGGELDALRLAGRVAARIASTSSGMRSAIDAGSPRRSAGAIAAACGIEGQHPAVVVEHHDRIGHAGDDGVEQHDVRRIAGKRGRRRRSEAALVGAAAEQPAQPADPARIAAVIVDRRHCAARKNAA